MNMTRKNIALAAAVLVLGASVVTAQKTKPAAKKALSAPPKEPKVSLVVFEDLQCPQCSRVAPLLRQASKTYNVPLVIHDFPLPMHPWSFQGAVFAHYFDAQNTALGHEFRDFIYQHQPEINPGNLRSFVEKFAAEKKLQLPFVIDPQGKFNAEVTAARDFATQSGIQHTPTVYVVVKRPQGDHQVEVKEPATDLYQTIEAALRE